MTATGKAVPRDAKETTAPPSASANTKRPKRLRDHDGAMRPLSVMALIAKETTCLTGREKTALVWLTLLTDNKTCRVDGLGKRAVTVTELADMMECSKNTVLRAFRVLAEPERQPSETDEAYAARLANHANVVRITHHKDGARNFPSSYEILPEAIEALPADRPSTWGVVKPRKPKPQKSAGLSVRTLRLLRAFAARDFGTDAVRDRFEHAIEALATTYGVTLPAMTERAAGRAMMACQNDDNSPNTGSNDAVRGAIMARPQLPLPGMQGLVATEQLNRRAMIAPHAASEPLVTPRETTATVAPVAPKPTPAAASTGGEPEQAVGRATMAPPAVPSDRPAPGDAGDVERLMYARIYARPPFEHRFCMSVVAQMDELGPSFRLSPNQRRTLDGVLEDQRRGPGITKRKPAEGRQPFPHAHFAAIDRLAAEKRERERAERAAAAAATATGTSG